MDKIILPEQDGITNLEIRRHRQKIEDSRADQTINPKTLDEVSKILDEVQRLCASGNIRGLALITLLPKKDTRDALAVFCTPDNDDVSAHEMWKYAAAWLTEVQTKLRPPQNPDDSA